MTTENQFSRIVEYLLAGGFICEYSDELAYEYLSADTRRSDIDSYLRKIGRCLFATEGSVAFYAAYTSIDSNDRRQDVRSQFRETINSLEPLCRWLRLLASTLQSETTLQPGDVLRQGELLNALGEAPALSEDLAGLCRSGLFYSKKLATSEQLEVVLAKLVDQGYLLRNTATGSLFTATGKWSYLYDVLEFIHTHETISAEDDESKEEQVDLPI